MLFPKPKKIEETTKNQSTAELQMAKRKIINIK